MSVDLIKCGSDKNIIKFPIRTFNTFKVESLPLSIVEHESWLWVVNQYQFRLLFKTGKFRL